MRWMSLALVLALLVPATALIARADDPAPGEAVTDAEIQHLVDQLGNDDFKVREAASRRLAELGERARAALEKAARESKSLEARWRAQQLVRRLGGAQKPEPVDEPESGAGDAPAPERGRRFEEDEVARLREMIERITKRIEEQFGRDGLGGWRRLGPLVRGLGAGPLALGAGPLRAPGLELRRTPGGVKLTVIDESGAGAEARTTYEGRSLDAILAAHPELKDHEGMAELKKKLADPWAGLGRLFGGLRIRPGTPGITTITSGNGVKISKDANGATVELREQREDGEWVTKTYKGTSLEDIKQKYPQVKKKLDETGYRFEIPGFQIFRRGRRPDRLEPARPLTPRPEAGPRFGIAFEAPDEILAMHLGLAEGEGGLVVQVVEDSQAQDLGIERGDIIVRVGPERITTGEQLERLLKQAARNRGPLEVEVIRRGKRRVLTR